MTEEEAMAQIYKILDSMHELGWDCIYLKDETEHVTGIFLATPETINAFKAFMKTRDQSKEYH